jgi:hypothetical protein
MSKTNHVNNQAVTITNKTSKFKLLTRPEIAPKGMQPGVITEVTNVTGTENGKQFSHMDIVFQLDAQNHAGKNFILTKSYNIAENGRGLTLFLKDYNSMNETEFSKTDLYDFEPETMKNMRAVAEVEYSETGKEVSSIIKTFYPVNQDAQPATV